MQTITAQAFSSGMRPGMQLVGFKSTNAIEDLLVIALGIYVLQRPQFKFCIITVSLRLVQNWDFGTYITFLMLTIAITIYQTLNLNAAQCHLTTPIAIMIDEYYYTEVIGRRLHPQLPNTALN